MSALLPVLLEQRLGVVYEWQPTSDNSGTKCLWSQALEESDHPQTTSVARAQASAGHAA